MDEFRDLDLDSIKELLENKQYTSLRQALSEINDADIAVVLENLDEEDRLKVFRILPKSMAADVFSYLELENQQMIITSLADKEAAGIINNLMADDAADLMEEMPASVVRRIKRARTLSICPQQAPLIKAAGLNKYNAAIETAAVRELLLKL